MERLTIQEADRRGLLNVGVRIRTNAIVNTVLTGTIDSKDCNDGYLKSEATGSIWRFNLNSSDWVEVLDNEVNEMVELDKFKSDNLKEAKKQFIEEHKNEEVEQAKKELKKATDNINRLDREIKVLEESKKPYLKIIQLVK